MTGCSTGIGRATAQHLAQRGWNVYARRAQPGLDPGARRRRLQAAGARRLRRAVDALGGAAVEQAEGAVGVLINNAGYSQSGAVEDVPMELVRRQFETNVFGLLRMCQLVLPGMRRQRFGRIVNVSSIGGRLAFPGGGIYHGTKHAVEGISRRAQIRGAGFGVDVDRRRARSDQDKVRRHGGRIDRRAPATETAPMRASTRRSPRRPPRPTTVRSESSVAGRRAVAQKIEKAISARRPKARYPVTASARLILTQRRLMTDRIWDGFLRTQFPQPGRAKD